MWRDRARARVLGLDADADLERRAPRRVDRRLERDDLADVTGSLNVMRSIPAVTQRRWECRTAASPAASSQ